MTKMRIFGIILSYFLGVKAVDRSKFRTCEQGSFCRRYKKWVDLQSRSSNGNNVQQWDLYRTDKPLSFQLRNSNEAEGVLKLDLSLHATGSVRFQINEVRPLHERYETPIGDVMVEMLPATPQYKIVEQTAEKVVYEWTSEFGNRIALMLKYKPFCAYLYVDGVLTMTANKRNLMNFERYRMKRGHIESAKYIDAALHPEVDKRGLWEENFGGHADTKPRGPAAVGMDINFEGSVEHVFGIPEHATPLSLKDYGEPFRLYNLDVFEYELNSPMALYGAVPLIWANQYDQANKKHTATSGVFWNNPSETFVKVEGPKSDSWLGSLTGSSTPKSFNTWWVSESGVIDLTLIPGPSPRHVSYQYHQLTGMAPMPPIFSLGKHQCRWNYQDEGQVEEVDSNYEGYDIPYDVIWLDIEHTDGKRYFTWEETKFPEPEKMVAKLASHGRKLVTIVDPHIKRDQNYYVYRELRDLDMLTKTKQWKFKAIDNNVGGMGKPNIDPAVHAGGAGVAGSQGTANGAINVHYEATAEASKHDSMQVLDYDNSAENEYDGWCWPGTSVYPDFTNPNMRMYWASLFAEDRYKGSTVDVYTWNDMNEPSVFNGPEVSAPRGLIHVNDTEHRDVHNLYGAYVQRATFEGHLMNKKNAKGQTLRPFVLTRSFYAGSQRYGAVWTGDNFARWDHLRASVAMVLSMALGGISFIGADVGGFFKDVSEELNLRWHQFGAIAYPFYRSHAHLETRRREPWVFSESARNGIREAVKTRYRFMPYWYTLFFDYSKLGLPIIRPVWYDFVEDEKAYDFDVMETQILVGPALLTKVVDKPDTSHLPMWLPGGVFWYDYYTYERHIGGNYVTFDVSQRVPLVAKGGSIIPQRWRQRRSATTMKRDPYTLMIFCDHRGEATGRLYIDDYEVVGSSYFEIDLSLQGNTLTSEVQWAEKVGSSIEDVQAVAGATTTQNTGEFMHGLDVERIVIVGFPQLVTGAVDNRRRTRIDIKTADNVVILKKPGVRFDDPWAISFETGSGFGGSYGRRGSTEL